jgi:ArsR family transcriptional regulator, arsenate/arsenite/antimonite-responsive transcriptional repressor
MHICSYLHTLGDVMKDLIKIYKVLSDESRLRILNLLLERPCCVCEVMQGLDITQSKASRGLTALYDTGILKLQKEGVWALYSIDWDGMDSHIKAILKATTGTFRENKTMEADRIHLQKAKRVGPACVCKTKREKAGVTV